MFLIPVDVSLIARSSGPQLVFIMKSPPDTLYNVVPDYITYLFQYFTFGLSHFGTTLDCIYFNALNSTAVLNYGLEFPSSANIYIFPQITVVILSLTDLQKINK